MRELTFAMAEIVSRARADKLAVQAERIILRPGSADGDGEFSVKVTGDGLRVRGEKPESWGRQTDLGNEDAVGVLADRHNRLGGEEKCVELGGGAGDTAIYKDT